MPTISVDRALGHPAVSCELDPDAIARFYNDLPLGDKPPIEDCWIHISSLAMNENDCAVFGAHYLDKELTKHDDPQAPPANIVIYAGTFVLAGSTEALSDVLQHELVHYAQATVHYIPDDHKNEVLATVLELRANQGCFSKAKFALGSLALGGIHLGITELLGSGDMRTSAVAGVLLQSLFRFIDRGKRHQRREELGTRLAELSYSLPHEQEASAYNNPELCLASISLRDSERAKKKVLQRSQRSTLATIAVDKLHQKLSLSPPIN